jgi:hypothetical protein
MMYKIVPWLLCLLALRFAPRCIGQTDTNIFDARKALRFWSALQRTNALRVGGFGDSVADPNRGGKIAGFLPPLRSILGAQSGGIVSAFPYLYFTTNGVGVYAGPDTNWWWNHHYLTNGSIVTFLSAINNGPSDNYSYVWSDTVAAYYLTDPSAGSFNIEISTNGSPFGAVCSINAAGPRVGAATNLSLPLDYYQMRIVCTDGVVTFIDGGMWNEHQPNIALTTVSAPGMAYNDWTSIPANITWPIFKAWKPDLLLLEAKDSAALFRASFPQLEQMFTNCAPNMDAIYIGTTPEGTNLSPTINQTWAIPQNDAMADLAIQFGRVYWNSFDIVTYEQATALGWTRFDGTHFNLAGGTALGGMLWSDLWSSFHRTEATVAHGNVSLSWYAMPGRTYQVQFSPTLSPPDWQNLGASLPATNYTMTILDAPGTPQTRFYRLLLLD